MVAGKFGVAALPGPDGTGSSSLGGANQAINVFSRYQRRALTFIKFFTSSPSESRILIDGSLLPVWTQLYASPAMMRRFPYLPVLGRAVLSAKPRLEIPSYNLLSLASPARFIRRWKRTSRSMRLSRNCSASLLPLFETADRQTHNTTGGGHQCRGDHARLPKGH
jgi:ABC-type glycerol-3-phosphate transport system substrate-binding protein